jgi:predicted TIM-barrel fold metal-dependent hydrolase
MYIPSIILTIIFIAFIIYNHIQKEKVNKIKSEADEKMTEEKRKEWQEKMDKFEKQKNESEINIVKTLFNCSEDKAKEKILILKKTDLDVDFFYYSETNEDKLKIFKKAQRLNKKNKGG